MLNDSNNVVIKVNDCSVSKGSGSSIHCLKQIKGTIDALNFAKLVSQASLEANPRDSKLSTITTDIIESLKDTPDLFRYKSKGLLVSSMEIEELDRNRFRLSFSDTAIEGILDGGHNVLAIGYYLISKLETPESRKCLKKIKIWNDFRTIWPEFRELVIEQVCPTVTFEVPIEILTGPDNVDSGSFFDEILEIAQARNNNCQLTEDTKAHKKGHYDILKKYIDTNIKSKTQWRTSDGGEIGARDLVALSMIPLSIVAKNIAGENFEINPVQIYSSKGACVKNYSYLFECASENGSIELFENAISLMSELPKIHDMLFQAFPESYNKHSPGYGRIGAVKVFDPPKRKEKKDKKYLSKKHETKFYQYECDYESPEGFVIPLLWCIRGLIENNNGKLVWKENPCDFMKENLDVIMEQYHGFIKNASYDPQKVGKSKTSYTMPESLVELILAKKELNK